MNLQKKSRTTAVLLALIAGPLGLMYVSPLAGIVLIVICYLTWWTLIIPACIWIFSIAWADHKAHYGNKAIDDFYDALGRRQ